MVLLAILFELHLKTNPTIQIDNVACTNLKKRNKISNLIITIIGSFLFQTSVRKGSWITDFIYDNYSKIIFTNMEDYRNIIMEEWIMKMAEFAEISKMTY